MKQRPLESFWKSLLELDLFIAMPLPIPLLSRKYGSLNQFPESPRESPTALNDRCR